MRVVSSTQAQAVAGPSHDHGPEECHRVANMPKTGHGHRSDPSPGSPLYHDPVYLCYASAIVWWRHIEGLNYPPCQG
jgi:hypothetical protein